MTIEELKSKRAKKKRMSRLITAVITLAAAIAVVAGILFYRSGLIPRDKEKTAPSADEVESVLTDGQEISGAEEAAGVNDLLGGLTPEPTPTPTPTPAVKTGWQKDNKGKYFLDEKGKRKTGFFTDEDGSVYYFDEDGYAVTGWQDLETGRCWFNKKGVMAKGVTKIGNSRYYFGYDGVMLTGWREDEDGNSYYFGEDGKAYTGRHTIDGKSYYFSKKGIMDPKKTKDAEVKADKLVCLTLDDGPGVYTSQFLDLLEENDAKATFFMIGEQVNDFASAVRREHDAGMEQGNHSWDHRTLTKLSTEDLVAEINDTNDVIEAVTGSRPTVFRPPGGGYNDEVNAHSDGMPVIIWSIDTLDWQTKDADNTYNVVMNEVRDGSIILMHEIYQASLDAAARFIPELRKQGYKFVTVSEMAKAKGIDLNAGQVYTNF